MAVTGEADSVALTLPQGHPPKQQHTRVLVFSYAVSKYPNSTAQSKLKEKGTEQVFSMTQQEAVL